MPGVKLHSSWATLIALAAMIPPRHALASAFDVQGLGPEGVAEVGARNARSDDGSAAFFNPAGLAMKTGTSLQLAPIVSFSTLHAQDKPLPIEDPFGLTVTASVTVPFDGPLHDRIRIGFSGHFLPQSALRLIARAPEEPFYPYYDNRSQRLVVLPAVAVRIAKHLGIGASADVLAAVRGPATLDDGASGAPEPRIDIAANTIMAAKFGIRFDPTTKTRLALVVRQSFGIPLNIDTSADIGGVPLATTLQSPRAMFDPFTITLAAGFVFHKATFESSFSYARWSDWSGPFLSVKSTLPGVNLVSRIPSGLFRDTITMRVGGNYTLQTSARTQLVLRAGIAGEPTILNTTLQGRTNLVDGNKLTMGLGTTFTVQSFIGKSFHVGFGANGQFLSEFSQDKRLCFAQPCTDTTVVGPDASDPGANITNPGFPQLNASGSVFTISIGVGVEL